MSRLGQPDSSFKSVFKKMKASLQRQRWKEALIFFCFVLLSLGFWLLQSLQQEYEIEIKIPVKYKNIPPDISFTNTPPQEIIAHVKDKGSVLLNYSFGRTFVPIEVNMKNQTDKSGTFTLPKNTIDSDIKKQLIATTILERFDPQKIELTYSKRIKKELPVVFNGDVQTVAGFKISGKIQINPQQVSVYASDLMLDTLKEVKMVFTEIKNGNKTITKNIAIEKIAGTAIEPANVSVTIPIEEYTEKTLEIPVICKDLPPHYTLRMFPPTVKVTCSIPLSRFKELSEDEFAVYISFADLEQNVSGTLPLKLAKKPDWVEATTIKPDKIEFILEQSQSHD